MTVRGVRPILPRIVPPILPRIVPPILPRGVPPILPRGVLLLAASLAAGCHHLIEPIQPLPVPLDEIQAVRFAPGTALRAENGYDGPVVRSIHADGIHEIEVDLRDWTARLIQEIEIELGRRGVTVVVPEASLEGTSIEPRPSPHAARDPASLPVLRAWITEVAAPDPEEMRGPVVAARIEAADGGFAASFTAGEHARGFRDALYELKKRVLDDGALQAWMRGACAALPSPVGPPGPSAR